MIHAPPRSLRKPRKLRLFKEHAAASCEMTRVGFKHAGMLALDASTDHFCHLS